MKRLTSIAAIIGLAWVLAACSGGSSDPIDDPNAGPLKINFVAASPNSGASPLRSTLTVNISGGVAPYFYAWDFTNDGSFDDYRNSVFLRTLSVQHDYHLLGDGLTDTVYQAVLRVTDSENTVITSSPLTITVNTTGGLTIGDVVLTSDEQASNGAYILKSGESIYFAPQISGGTAPYKYQWDFDNNGSVDSTLANPEFTYTYAGLGVKTFVAKLRVLDASGQTINRDVLVSVEGSANTGGGGNTDFSIVLSSDPPADAAGNIILNWDNSANNPDLPLEPGLDLAVVVDASQGGSPPFEYYWDFEGDGVFDSQSLSPTIPYYDPQRKILVNPYLHQEKTKTYLLRVFVIDSLGKKKEATRNIISNNQENVAGRLNVTAVYGAIENNAFTATPPQPYKEVGGPLGRSDIRFTVTATGSTGDYDWQLDIDGDGVADWPSLADEPTGFADLTSGTATTDIKFGFYDDGGLVSDWPALGYYPVKAIVRSYNKDNDQTVETFKLELPVSLVRIDPVVITGGPALLSRSDAVLMGAADTAIPGANGNYIPSRRVVIAGGATGVTTLSDVQEIVQTFAEPTAANTLEVASSATVTGRFPLNQPRTGAVGTTDGTYTFMLGGQNNENGILGTSEASALATNSPWAIAGEIRAPGYIPLTKSAGTFLPVAVGGIGPGFLFAGGLTPAGTSQNVSGRLIFTDLQDTDGGTPGWQGPLAFRSVGGAMVTPRYDAAMAFANGRLYVIGGRVANGRSVSTVEAFNLNNGQWENAASLKDFRSGAQAEVIDGIIYVHGGAFYPGNDAPGGGGNRTVVATSECFNPLTGVWSYTVGLPAAACTENGASTPIAGAGSAATLPALLNQIWYHGGRNNASAEVNAIHEFTYFYTITPTP